MKIRYQLVFLFILVILFSVTIVTVVLSNNAFRSMKEIAVSNYSRMNSQIAVNIDGTINSVDHYYNFLISNRLVFNSLHDVNFGITSESYNSVIYLKDLLFSIISITDGLHSAFFFSKSGSVVSTLNGSLYPEFLREENLKRQPFIDEIYNNPAEAIWLTDELEESGYIFYMRGLRDPVTGEILGILCFVINPEVFENNIYMLSGGASLIYICDETGHPFISNSPLESIKQDPLFEVAKQGPGFFEFQKNYYFSDSNINSWIVITELPENELINIKDIWIIGMVTFLACVIIAGLLSLFLSGRIARDLSILADAMNAAGSGRLEKTNVHGSNYETRSLSESYNKMIVKIDRLTQNLRNEINEKEKAEHEVESLVRFTNENPSPIVRLSSDGTLNYYNIVAEETVVDNLFKNNRPTPSLFEEYTASLESGNEFDAVTDNRAFKVQAISTTVNDDVFLHFRDFTVEREYAYLQNLWENMFENSVEGIIITDSNGIVERINTSFTKITGYEFDDVKGKSTKILKSNRHPKPFYSQMWDSLVKTGKWSGEIWNRRKSGEAYPEWLGITAFSEASSGRLMYFAVFHDVSDKKQNEERLHWMTNYDALTGLPMRSMFLNKLRSELKAAERNDEACALLLMNIDGLKNINNTFGPHIGDAVLQEFSRRLKLSLRNEDIVSRFGGDEFVILAPRLKEKARVYSILKRLRAAIDEPILIEDFSIDLSVSFGIAFSPDDGATDQAVLAKAGSALSRTKSNRKGSYSLFDSSLDDAVMANSEMEMYLRKALNLGELELFYQPKVDAREKRVKGVEALLRWKREHKEYVPPYKFIPIAEETGIIVEIGYFVIREACDLLIQLRNEGFEDIQVGINISARQLAEPDFIDNLMKIVESKDIQPADMDLEVTESVTASEVYNAIESLARLSELGFTISIDDFGTGYSSFKYLLTLPFDTIKIDKSFVDAIVEKEGNVLILDSMISLAHSLDKKLVAEGVETVEQLNYLVDKNCPVIQGYYYSKPLPEQEIMKFIKSEKYKTR